MGAVEAYTPAVTITTEARASTGASRTCLVLESDGTRRALEPKELDRISELRDQQGRLVWLNLADPTREDLTLLEREFAIHRLAMDDVRRRRQRAKVDTYTDQHMIVAYEVRPPSAERAGRRRARSYELGELHLFAGSGWLVTVHWGTSPAIDDLRRRVEAKTTEAGNSVGGLVYTLLDEATDTYFPVLDRLAERMDALEDEVLSRPEAATGLREMLAIKRELLELRRAAAPLRDVVNTLLRRDIELIEDEAVPYFQDLYDHLVRVLDQIDLYRDLLAAVVEARLTVTSNNLNAIMKRLTAFTVILMVPTLIAGIYGMNFELMPETQWTFGYPLALGLMVAAVIGVIAFFRAKDWL
jgi:magnesium transporter